MKTSKQWLNEVKNDTTKLHRWLSRQWLAEVDASKRIADLSDKVPLKYKNVLMKIAKDESKHAYLLGVLCKSRDIECSTDTTSRYYSSVDLPNLSVDELCALGHYAEGMRLDRIQAICDDSDIDSDIKEAFNIILKDELMHEKAFGIIASTEAKSKMKNQHVLAAQALGLVV